MKSMNIMKAIVLASALALPAFFAGNAFATSCGACVPGTGPILPVMDHTSINAAMMACTTCHTAAPVAPAPTPIATPAPAPVVTASPAPAPTAGTITVRRTSASCGACAIGTAPSSVSAHKNVNSTMTVCVACHSSNSTVVSAGGSSSGRTLSGMSGDDHKASTRRQSSERSDNHGKRTRRGNDD